jgi:hypothetical protein
MVKLRSGKSYLNRTYFNYKVEDFNSLIFYITDELKINDYKVYLKNLIYKKPNIYKDFNEILKYSKCIKTYVGTKGGKYYYLNGKKKYFNATNKEKYRRNQKLEEISILISKFMTNYKKIIKEYQKIKSEYVELCSICYSNIKKGDKIVMCKNRIIDSKNGSVKNIIHPYHKTCFDTNLQYAHIPFICKTKFGTKETIKLYECPYCRQKKINTKDIYTVM